MNESRCNSATTGCHTKAQHFDKDEVYKELQTFLEFFFFKENQMFIMDLSADFLASTTHAQDTVHLLGS